MFQETNHKALQSAAPTKENITDSHRKHRLSRVWKERTKAAILSKVAQQSESRNQTTQSVGGKQQDLSKLPFQTLARLTPETLLQPTHLTPRLSPGCDLVNQNPCRSMGVSRQQPTSQQLTEASSVPSTGWKDGAELWLL